MSCIVVLSRSLLRRRFGVRGWEGDMGRFAGIFDMPESWLQPKTAATHRRIECDKKAQNRPINKALPNS